MKEALIAEGPRVQIVDSEIPKPERGQLVIKVVFSGSNPKDWKVPEWMPGEPLNQGDDISGIVHEVGENVSEFKKGDRVAAFHEMRKPGGSYAEYAVAWASTTFHLPDKTTFEEGAAIPLAALTAAVGLYARLKFPEPWFPIPSGQKTPLVVYGASSAVGSYAIQLAKRSNIHPIIAVAGRAQSHVEKLIDPTKGDTIVDYRGGNEAVVQGIRDALSGEKLYHAFDAISEHNSYQNISQVLEPRGKITLVLPLKEYKEIPDSVEKSITMVGAVHGTPEDLWDFGFVWSRYIGKGLEEGWFEAQPQEIIPGGLTGIESGLTKLKNGEASAVKYIFKLSDTPGVSQ